jgi:hypothetical protein
VYCLHNEETLTEKYAVMGKCDVYLCLALID